MSKFIELNVPGVPEQSEAQNLNQTFVTSNDVCVCCLSQNVPLISLDTCKHALNCNIFFVCKIMSPFKYFCAQCHSILVKFSEFKKQIESNIRLLDNQFCRLKPNKNMLNLMKTPTEIFWAVNSEPIQKETQNTNENLVPSDIFVTEPAELPDTDWTESSKPTSLKLEHKSSDHPANDTTANNKAECSNDIPFLDLKVKTEADDENNEFIDLLVINKEEELPSRKRRKVSSELPLSYQGKLKVTKLNKKEYLAEKEAERTKASFSILPFKCEYCVVAFDHEVNLKEHNEKKHTKKEGDIKCDLCKSYFCSRHSYLDHYKRHFKRYECMACFKRYTTLQAAGEHYKQQHGGVSATYTCDQCDFTTDSNRKYRYHRQKHKDREQCTQCGKTFVTKSGLKIHLLTKHSDIPSKENDLRFSCARCDKTYATKNGLAQHIASVHEQNGAFCVTCQVHFRTRNIYQNHLATNSKHVNDKHPCELCEAKFLTRSALKHHVDYVHLKTVGHPCDKCGKVYPFARTLRRHKAFVHDKKQMPKNKICDHCGKGFSTLSILRAHVRTHTGERPLRCTHCAAAFAHPAALYNHTKMLHARAHAAKHTHSLHTSTP